MQGSSLAPRLQPSLSQVRMCECGWWWWETGSDSPLLFLKWPHIWNCQVTAYCLRWRVTSLWQMVNHWLLRNVLRRMLPPAGGMWKILKGEKWSDCCEHDRKGMEKLNKVFWHFSNGSDESDASLNLTGKSGPAVEQHTQARKNFTSFTLPNPPCCLICPHVHLSVCPHVFLSVCLCAWVSSGCKWWDAHLQPSRVQCFPEGECP